jgi:hypothetical protein
MTLFDHKPLTLRDCYKAHRTIVRCPACTKPVIWGIVSETNKPLLVEEDDNGQWVLDSGRWLSPYVPKVKMVYWRQRYSTHKLKCTMEIAE